MAEATQQGRDALREGLRLVERRQHTITYRLAAWTSVSDRSREVWRGELDAWDAVAALVRRELDAPEAYERMRAAVAPILARLDGYHELHRSYLFNDLTLPGPARTILPEEELALRAALAAAPPAEPQREDDGPLGAAYKIALAADALTNDELRQGVDLEGLAADLNAIAARFEAAAPRERQGEEA